MATERQKKAIKLVVENRGNVSKSMRQAGYTDKTAKNPKNLTESDAWKEIMEKALPDKLLSKVHKEGLSATRKEQKIVGRDDEGKVEYDLVDVEDYSTRHRYLESAYKLKGKFAPEKKELSFDDEDRDTLKDILNSLRQ